MPIDYSHYPDNWLDIRASILSRAQNRCEWCGVFNHAVGVRSKHGDWYSALELEDMPPEIIEATFKPNFQLIQIVLTVAHLDHDISHNDESNLAALCQRCHLNHDRRDNAERRFMRRMAARGQLSLFDTTL